MKMDPETWRALSELLDQWLDQPEEHRGEWLERLGPEHERIVPVLRKVIGKQSAIDSAGFLNTLPEIDGRPNLAAGWAAQPDAGLIPGALVGPYRLLRELGQGGMGVVWLAERADGAPKRPVALKVPILSLHNRTMADLFARERDILAQLVHPSIARLYDAGVTPGGQPYFALEYVEGQKITAITNLTYPSKEAYEFRDDPVDKIREIMERFQCRFTADNPRIVERYIDIESMILLHFTVDGFGEEYVAQFERFISRDSDEVTERIPEDLTTSVGQEAREATPSEVGVSRQQERVLVSIVQLVQLPKCVTLPSFIRLGRVDSIYSRLPNALYLSSTGWVMAGKCTNWKGETFERGGRRSGIGLQEQLANDVVQTGSEAVQCIGGDRLQLRGEIIDPRNVVTALSRVRVFLESNAIRIGVLEGFEGQIKILNVLFGPCNFGENALRDVSHTARRL
jgi:hypothetical protein